MLVDPVSVTGPGTVVTFKQIEKVPQLQRKKKKITWIKCQRLKLFSPILRWLVRHSSCMCLTHFNGFHMDLAKL